MILPALRLGGVQSERGRQCDYVMVQGHPGTRQLTVVGKIATIF